MSALFDELRLAIRRSPLGVYEIARRSGVSYGTIYFWLRGTTKTPLLRKLEAVADVLGLVLVFEKGRMRLRPAHAPAAPAEPIWRRADLYRWQNPFRTHYGDG